MKLKSLFWQPMERRLARYLTCRNANLTYDRGIVCFTFDDLWHSACIEGARILKKYGVRGTFYVSGGMTGTNDYHTEADLLHLVSGGHELGCHGFGHRSYQSISKAEILTDIQDNRLFFKKLGCDAPKNFAYPYGHVSPFAKRITSYEFTSLRGIQPGINFATTDLALLRSFPLYEQLWTRTKLTRLLEQNAKLGGLLIFFTHGVLADPKKFDCSIDLLDFAVRAAITSGNRVTPVRDALPIEAR